MSFSYIECCSFSFIFIPQQTATNDVKFVASPFENFNFSCDSIIRLIHQWWSQTAYQKRPWWIDLTQLVFVTGELSMFHLLKKNVPVSCLNSKPWFYIESAEAKFILGIVTRWMLSLLISNHHPCNGNRQHFLPLMLQKILSSFFLRTATYAASFW